MVSDDFEVREFTPSIARTSEKSSENA